MTNRVNLSDLRLMSQNDLYPRELESSRNIVKRFIKVAVNDIHAYSIVVEWMGKHSNNFGNTQTLINELELQVEFEKHLIEFDDDLENKAGIIQRMSELQTILKHFLSVSPEHYRLIRSFLLEYITQKYISVRYNIRKRNVFHEPTIFAKRKPLIPASKSSSHKYRPNNIKVDFAFKMTRKNQGLFLYECKASLAEFLKSIENNTNRAKSSLHKIRYILAVRDAFSSKVFDSEKCTFEAVMTTYVDSPDYAEKDLFGFPQIIKPININIIKDVLFR